MSKITVVIPCYNASEYLERCIRSFEEQTYKDFSVIFIDDCSTDNTVMKIQELKKTSNLDITLLFNARNSGPAVSRNRGIEYAKSEYITFCDCDDWYEKNFLEEMIAEMNQGVDIAFCGYRIVNEKGEIQKRPLIEKDAYLDSKEVLSLDVDSLCMMMVKASLMKETLLPDIRNGEDVAVVPLLIIKSKKCVVKKECLYNYFRRQGSASQAPSMIVVDSLIESFLYTKSKFPEELKEELEFLGIKNLLYSTMITLFSFDYDVDKVKEIRALFESDFPNWSNNKYYNQLTFYKKAVLFFLKVRCYFGIKILALIRKTITK